MPTSEDTVLTPAQVAKAFQVSTTTVAAWADSGKLRSFRTPGNQRRFWQSDVDAFRADQQRPEEVA